MEINEQQRHIKRGDEAIHWARWTIWTLPSPSTPAPIHQDHTLTTSPNSSIYAAQKRPPSNPCRPELKCTASEHRWPKIDNQCRRQFVGCTIVTRCGFHWLESNGKWEAVNEALFEIHFQTKTKKKKKKLCTIVTGPSQSITVLYRLWWFRHNY